MGLTAHRHAGMLLLGADVGATHSRVKILDGLTGPCVGRAEGPGYNVNSSGEAGPDPLADTVVRALREAATASSRRGPFEVAGVLGIAGAGPAAHDRVQTAVREALAAATRTSAPGGDGRPGHGQGIVLRPEQVTVVDDLVTAFAAGSHEGDGVLLLAGTGSAGARFRGFAPVARIDGMGWLLGDTGSAVSIGRSVLEAAAADLDGRGPPTALTAEVMAHFGIGRADALADPGVGPEGERPAEPTGDPRQDLIRVVYERTPAQWGTLALLPERHPEDAVARGILGRAAEELVLKVDAMRDGDRDVVLAGSVLRGNQEIGAAVMDALDERGLRALPAAEAVDGALHLARLIAEREAWGAGTAG